MAAPYDIIQVQKTLDDLKKYNIDRMVLSPTRWAACKIKTPLQWFIVKFEKSQKIEIPEDKQGVYTFVVKPGIANHPECAYLLYVGKTEQQSLRKRFLQYFNEVKKPKGRIHIKDMVLRWGDHLWFCYAPIEAIEQIADIENSLIEAYVPPHNEEYPGIVKEARKAWR